MLKAVEGGADLAESIQAEKDIAAEILESAGKAGFGNVDEGKGNLSESERADKMVSNVYGG